jgi:RNase H-fold protein (predicted Holliday junction resolvase)
MPSFNDNDPIYLKPTHYSGNTTIETLQDIQAIVQLCKQNKVQLIVFINPIHHTTYQDTNKQLLYQFKRSLAIITPYYDFSGPNKITKDNHNYVDTSHYTVDIGDQILKVMSRDQSVNSLKIISKEQKIRGLI